jgi:hypothetical protein
LKIDYEREKLVLSDENPTPEKERKSNTPNRDDVSLLVKNDEVEEERNRRISSREGFLADLSYSMF